MSKIGKMIWLIVAGSLVLLGCIIFVGVMGMLKWDFGNFLNVKYEANTYEVSEEFKSLAIDTTTADVALLPSEDGKCRVVCYENAKTAHSVEVVGDTLTVNMTDTRRWYDHISFFSTGNPMITVYLPNTEYEKLFVDITTGDVGITSDFSFESITSLGNTGDITCSASAKGMINIERTTGAVRLENISVGAMDVSITTGHILASNVACVGDIELETSTGDVSLEDVTCNALSVDGGTSDVILKRVVADKYFDIETGTGDVSFDRCDAMELSVETTTGDVTGTLLTDKIFFAQTSTGDINVPRTMSGGKCEIETTTGKIEMSIENN